MNIGECVILQIQGERYKFRKEYNGYYCVLPTTLKLIQFNEVGFQILSKIARGLVEQEIIVELMEQYKMDQEFWQARVDDFLTYLADLQICARGR